MNVLITLSQLEVTGAEAYAVTLADKLIDKGYNVIICSDTLTLKCKADFVPNPFNKRSIYQRISQVIFLVRIIKKFHIQIIHANSRASSWVSFFAAKAAKIPLINTVHGRQHVHSSSLFFSSMGNYILPVCENIKKQLIDVFKISKDKIQIVRNGIEPPRANNPIENKSKIFSVIGRLSGPKGEVTELLIKNVLSKIEGVKIYIIGGKTVPERFKKYFSKQIEFVGFVNNIEEWIVKSDLIFGSGRVAIESLMLGKNVAAIGEAKCMGIVTNKNFTEAIESNFGDISADNYFDWNKLKIEVESFIKNPASRNEVSEKIKEEYDVEKFVKKIERIYQTAFVNERKYEIPILTYHRLVKDKSETGKHGIYITVEQFESHLKYLKNNNFSTINFNQLELEKRFDRKNIILTFDDGYEDNYTLLFPLLKKYEFTAVIFMVTEAKTNSWDSKSNDEPELKLMNENQIKEMSDYGIEFGAHTRNHLDLTTIQSQTAFDEIYNSKLDLEKVIDKKIISFSYPFGKLNNEIKKMVESIGYKFGIATDTGPLAINEDLFHVRRIGIMPNTNLQRFKRKVKGNYSFIRVNREVKKK